MTMEAPTIDQQSRPRQGGLSAREREFAKARRHSRRVRMLKIGLPAAAVLMALAFAAVAFLKVPGGVSIDIASTSISDGKLVMANPKLGGFTRNNQRYAMSAERAIQDLADGNRIRLEEIAAELPFNRANSATIAAASGVFDRAANNLTIEEGLTIRTRDGMEAVLESAFVDIATNTMETKDPVEIRLNGARLVADSMATRENGHVIVFERRVRVDIDPGGLNPALAAAGSMLARD